MKIALGIEFHHRIEFAAGTVINAATIHHPDVTLAVARHPALDDPMLRPGGSLKKIAHRERSGLAGGIR